MRPIQVEQNNNYAVLRYSQVIFSTAVSTLTALFSAPLNIKFSGAAGSDVLTIPELGKSIRRMQIRLNPNGYMDAFNNITATYIRTKINILALRCATELGILYDGSGILSESMSGDFVKEFFRPINNIQFSSAYSNILVDASHPVESYLVNGNISFSMIAANAQAVIILTPEIRIWF